MSVLRVHSFALVAVFLAFIGALLDVSANFWKRIYLALWMFVAMTTVAAAQAANSTVVVPWGDFVASLLNGSQQIIALLLMALVSAVLAMLPAWVQNIARPLAQTYQVDQLLAKLASTVVGGTKGVVAGRTVEIPIANDMVRNMVQMIVTQASPRLLEFIGTNAESLAQKVLARLQEKGVIPPDYTLDHATEAAQHALDITPVPRA